MTTEVYSIFDHIFSCNDGKQDVVYNESQWVKSGRQYICINAVDKQEIGRVWEPEYPIHLYATKSWEERKDQDFNKLGKARQIVNYCNDKQELFHKDGTKGIFHTS
jgi:hypothetical protein